MGCYWIHFVMTKNTYENSLWGKKNNFQLLSTFHVALFWYLNSFLEQIHTVFSSWAKVCNVSLFLIGHYERTFTADCVITKFCFFLVNTMNASCSRCSVGREKRFATGCNIQGSNLGGDKIFLTRLDRPWRPPCFQCYGYWVCFPPPPGEEIRTIPLSPIWALMACSRVTFTFTCPYPVLQNLLYVR